ncbi:NAD(P)-dependent dehydrogenase (short-subunit alcohol dehydrogenase family) [Pseudomonas sp. 2848]|jgi:NAD(P)-dependent dehydrogenase (short-subunit alcohol dehydrogenase family)|uniref:SDR family NAD(P)-dependent oxidoreductase n=1 Tax=Pseudomonas sp. 2848 TaxID=2183926 RepID=UPI000DAC9F5A|nr:SDR family NAD(P)-dependent oxidoreductase [Pseudomonas sp. 2848]PZW77377.1 NAD(P)-dependent dehydrogenase (short-subunit alcohol dehydrogenase family) [Pseudomonas sp. 2848]
MSLITNLHSPANVLVCGASQGIGLALCEQLLAREDVGLLIAVSRQANCSTPLDALALIHGRRLMRIDCDARDEQALQALAVQVQASCAQLNLVISTLGVLHQPPARAEKSLAQLDMAGLQASFVSNCFAPLLLLKHLLPWLRQQPATFAALSARVGSISDNHLGGWYSYRASKAALNQLLRTASIELKRLNPASTVLALHPGTTDTQLSRPFQGNVPIDKLFSPAFAARCILELIGRHGPSQTGTFWAWDGRPIPW